MEASSIDERNEAILCLERDQLRRWLARKRLVMVSWAVAGFFGRGSRGFGGLFFCCWIVAGSLVGGRNSVRALFSTGGTIQLWQIRCFAG
ncbi:MAG: hypothetical protein M2R45_04637 [Verrucomicrobia subdivision 3 bacterium]|nr:hypothetical protein [Limisphaerales bacterium]MCS1417129.1 hypothetical protein [Limisphaerales bacterium]